MIDLRGRRAALLTVIPALALSACGGGSSGTAGKSADAIRAAGAKLPSDYSYVLTSGCARQSLRGTHEIVVVQGRVTSVTPVDVSAAVDYPTVTALLDSALGAGAEADVEFGTDAAGLPARLSIDPDRNTSDDEQCYVFSGITPVPGQRSPG
ncbi:hypothetical protein Acy02nite_69910 [Actinoplanes cyaneus]|uniref:Lipoprotein n=1 Tax=Actinoplanes cyaneus TaxID=52696 RepID=A0A919M485_9ACTN|nr:DUF6174 domain-containing protein [Actinoplanes cyaneus]MCW2140858.1 hypothetical protein [Actinoplanes cyaneus]GID69110.1 hypothetical protein Acy02nite_69910 [Actinoplanes cyaneus]